MTEEARASQPACQSVAARRSRRCHSAMPVLTACVLGIREAMFTAHGRDVWLCDTHGEIDA